MHIRNNSMHIPAHTQHVDVRRGAGEGGNLGRGHTHTYKFTIQSFNILHKSSTYSTKVAPKTD